MSLSTVFDVVILGAGIAGASLAAELAPTRRVLLLEIEDQPGMHSTGRSAATFFENYGNRTVRSLTRASRQFYEQPPAGFCEAALLAPRHALFVTDHAREHKLKERLSSDLSFLTSVTAAEVCRMCPVLSSDWVSCGALDTSGHDLDVAATFQGFLRTAKRSGATVLTGASETSFDRSRGLWRIQTKVGTFEAPTVVNAAGAWADRVAVAAGVSPIGLQPMRRTIVMLPAPAGVTSSSWPMVVDLDELFYFKSETGQILLSPANEDPMSPCDVAPDEMDVALAIDRFETATGQSVQRINSRWAGLRTFAPDRSPVVGFDKHADGFFWLAGQGGYGIQMAPALARTAASLLTMDRLPEDVASEGVTVSDLSAARAQPSRQAA